MMIVWPSDARIFSARMRPMTSVDPPAGNGTTIVIGRKSDSARCKTQKTTAWKFHGVLPCCINTISISVPQKGARFPE